MSQKRITIEEVEQFLSSLEGRFKAEGNVPKDGAVRKAYLNLIRERLENQQGDVSSTLEAGPVAGLLYIYIVSNPMTWNYRTNVNDRYFGDFTGSHWLALFKEVLECPMEPDLSLSSVEATNFSDTYKLQFEKAIPDYPMLARMWNTYGDAVYESDEVARLRAECLNVKAATSNSTALLALDNLLHACNDALQTGCGLYLASD